MKDLSSSISNFQSCVLIANGFCKLEEILISRVQLNVSTGGCHLVFCLFLDLITTIVTCRVALTRGRSNPVEKKIWLEDSKVAILRSLMLFKVGLFGVVE